MNGQRNRIALVAASLVTLALAAPIHVWGANGGAPESNPILRNDIAHFGRTTNDKAVSPAARQPAAVVVRVESGFDWVSAAVGAAGGLGVAVLGGGAVSVLRRRPAGDSMALSGR
jgi:hypothetical protein